MAGDDPSDQFDEESQVGPRQDYGRSLNNSIDAQLIDNELVYESVTL